MSGRGEDKQDKVVLITGASSGIGEATAIEYAKLGYKVAITGRNEERLQKVLEQLIASSPIASGLSQDNFLTLKADFEDPAQVEPIVARTIAKLGRLDILVNNAGYLGERRSLRDPDFYDDFQRVLQVNLFAAVRLCHLARPHLEQSKGVIINVSSVADQLGCPNISNSVSKAGLNMLTQCVANALDGTGCRVVTVSPGPIETNFLKPEQRVYLPGMAEITTLRRIGQPKEVADLIVFLSSDKASFITGCSINVDGGFVAKFGGTFITHKKILE